MTRAEVIALGESMGLVTPSTPQPLEYANSFVLEVGGAESNVALYLASLGHEVSWVSAVGDDPIGRRLITSLADHDVDTQDVRIDTDAQTGVYFKDPGDGASHVYYYRRGSAASRMEPSLINGLVLSDARIVHLSGVTPGLSESCAALTERVFSALTGAATLLSFDVNFRPGVWPQEIAAEVLLELSRRSNICFVGRDEAEFLWGTSSAATVRDLIPQPGRLVVKDGSVGATEFSSDGAVFVESHAVDVVEAVGAGDAFAAGYLSGVLRGMESEASLRRGHDTAARALSTTADFAPRADGGTPREWRAV